MIGFCPLASGSQGNAIYFGTDKVRLLIDAGLSLRELTHRLSQIGVDVSTLDAVLITHEHIDHIKGLMTLCRKWNLPIFANKETAKAILAAMQKSSSKEELSFRPKFKLFSTGERFVFADVKVNPFSIQHDAIEPVAFTFEVNDMKIGVCADLGFASTLVMHQLQRCHYLYLEANHEPSMVHASSRPLVYKQRVLGRQGHLSNTESADLLAHVYHADLKHVYLAHLSSECNTPEVALKVMRDRLAQDNKEVSMAISWQDRVSDLLPLA